MKSAPLVAIALSLSLGACAGMSDSGSAMAPQPTRPVDAQRFYTGVWHEIARNPMKLTDGCVAGVTEFQRDESGKLIDRDSCRKDTPMGEEKVFAGPVEVDPANNAKFTTHYKVVGPFGPSRTYWILDNGMDAATGGWFIVATPSFKDLSIFTRNPQIGPETRASLVARARAFGYDVNNLEFPAQPTN